MQVFSEQWKTLVACFCDTCLERCKIILKEELLETQVFPVIKANQTYRSRKIISNYDNKAIFSPDRTRDLFENHTGRPLQKRSIQSGKDPRNTNARKEERIFKIGRAHV